QIQQNPAAAPQNLALLSSKIKSETSKLIDEQKEIHSNLSKCGKAIDKKFTSFDLNWDPKAFEGKDETLNKTLALHLIRQGRFDLGENFIKEANLDVPDNLNSSFVEMYKIVEALRQHNLEPALSWADTNQHNLSRIDSSLAFNLHKLRYIQLLTSDAQSDNIPIAKSNGVKAALEYAKKNFENFGISYIKEIQQLTCAVLFYNRLSNSKYADLLSPSLWVDVQNQFTRDFCSMLGLSPESPFVLIGTSALPIIMKMSQIMKEKKNEWTSQNELPVEIPLHPGHRYHSIFACPVSREQGTEENPPMMMPCGHVISKESLNRLSKGGGRFKCPYCPSESNQSQATRIYL
ncbi:CTLH/CRA C-terminal to lish motif domain-containing protein, partial [Paraphysoderma sedebokerense]